MKAVEITLWALVALRLVGTGLLLARYKGNAAAQIGAVLGQAILIGVLVWAAVSIP